MLRKFDQMPMAANLRRFLRLFMLTMALGFVHGAQNAQAADDDYLRPDVAFKFSARMADPRTVEITYAIADGYYLYREQFAFNAIGAKLGTPLLPTGKIKFDDTFKKDVESYRKTLVITMPVEAAGSFTLAVTSQGCADKGLCYPPMESSVQLSSAGGVGMMAAIATVKGEREAADMAQNQPTGDSEMSSIEAALKSGKLLAILPLFILLGLGLSFTPCLLPMVPILSSIIVGEGRQVGRARGFLLAATYSLGMALVYTALGVAAGLIGEGLAAALQTPWVLTTFALLLVVLAFSMFGFYQLQMPAAIQTRLTNISDRQTAGKLAGVFTMGALSALIVGPCVAAPLAGVLVYISQTRDVVVGGSALFAMAVGMSVPLLLIGLSAGSLLPRAGAWMESVKRFFGVLMLGVALWMISPLLPAWVQMLAWAALGLGYGAYLLWREAAGLVLKAIGLACVVLGMAQLVGVATGGRDALTPLAHLTGPSAKKAEFTRIKSGAELDAALTKAKGKIVVLDFYADWCVSCKEMEKLTFSDPRVQAQFNQMVLLQADVTANNADDKALLKRFRLFGPPGIIFFDKQGQEIQGGRVIGYQNADRFLRSLALIATF